MSVVLAARMVCSFQLRHVLGSSSTTIQPSYSISLIEATRRGSHTILVNLGDGEGDGRGAELTSIHLLTSFTVTGTFNASLPNHFFSDMSLWAALDSSIVFPAMPPSLFDAEFCHMTSLLANWGEDWDSFES